MSEPLKVSVVSPGGLLWQGRAISILVRTTEGDVGILPGHQAFMGVVVPCAAEVVSPDGTRDILAVSGGFVSVWKDHVSLLSDSAELARNVSVDDAHSEIAALYEKLEQGELSDVDQHLYNRLVSQIKAGSKLRELNA